MSLYYKSLLFFFLGFSISLSAQNPHPPWRNYTTEDGLPASEVHYCLETSDGYLWFATDNGLSRFDGYTFKNYGIKEGLGDPVIFYMQLDSQGRLWMATISGKLFYLDAGHIYAFENNHIITAIKESTNAEISDFYIDEEDKKMLSLRGAGVLAFDKKGEHILHYPSHPHSNRIAVKSGKRWLTAYFNIKDTIKPMLDQKYFDRGKEPPMQMVTDSTYEINDLDYNNIIGVYLVKEFRDSRTLIYGRNQLYEIGKNKIIWSRKIPYELNYKSIYEGENGFIYSGLANGMGLRRYRNLDAWRNEDYDQYLQGKSISQIFKDSNGNFWVATIDSGVFFCPNLEWEIYDQSAGLSNNYAASIAVKNDHELFVGLRNREIYHLDTKTKALILIPEISIKGTSVLYDLIYYPDMDELWAGVHRHAYLKNGQWNQLTHVTNNEKITSAVIGHNLTLRKGSHQIWGGSSSHFGGINMMNKEIILYSPDLNIAGRTLVVRESADRTIWVGNTEGLFELSDTLLVRPTPFYPEFKTRVEDLAEMSDSTLVIGTKGQGVLFKKDDLFKQIDSKNGLTADMIENVYVDEWDHIWVGTLNGLNKISDFQWGMDTTFSIRQFTTQNGLPSNEVNKIEVSGDDVWIATTKGLLYMKDKNAMDSLSRSPILSGVSINGTPLKAFENTSLSYDQNDIVFQYLTINFRQNGNIPYRHRLLPVQEAWTETNERTINFSALENSNYTFEVQSRNVDGFWSASTTFEFQIHPPFWKTGWFLSVMTLLISSMIYFYYKSRINQIRNEAEVIKQMADLESSALRAQMNPHFIFNSLNAIQGYIAEGDKALANRYLSQFSKLIRIALQHSQVSKVPLEDDLNSLKHYLELEQLRFKDNFDYKINVQENLDFSEIDIPPMLVQPFVENAIIHGLTKKESKGLIELDFQKENGFLWVTIADNGIGIEVSKKQKLEQLSSHKSVGMSVTERRLNMLKGVKGTGKVSVKELKDKKGNAIGTQVVLQIPL